MSSGTRNGSSSGSCNSICHGSGGGSSISGSGGRDSISSSRGRGGVSSIGSTGSHSEKCAVLSVH